MQKKVFIKNNKGLNLAAVIHRPEKETDRLAILCPGYLDSKDYNHLVGLAEELTKGGYTVIRFNPTGTWDSEGSIEEYTTTQYLADIKNVLEYMLAKRKYSHILLGGHSRGGRVSVLYATRDSRITLVLVVMTSGTPVIDNRRKQAEELGFTIETRDVPGERGEREYRVPLSHFQDNDQYDLIKSVKEIKVPIVVVAGGADVLVNPDWTKKIYDNANKPKKFILMKSVGHNYRQNIQEVKAVNDKIIEAISDIRS